MAGLEVRVKDGDLEKALKVFKKKLMQSGLLKELRDSSFYLKPSKAAKVKRQRAEHRRRKSAAKAAKLEMAQAGRGREKKKRDQSSQAAGPKLSRWTAANESRKA